MAVKVLIIESNAVARNFLGRVVRESFSDDMEIFEATTQEAACSFLNAAFKDKEDDRFQLILLDMELPGGNSLEILALLKNDPAIKVVTTLYSDDDTLFPALQNGADGYLLKEDRFEVLIEELQKIARGTPPLSPAIARRLLSLFRTSREPGFFNSSPSPFQSFPEPDEAHKERLSAAEYKVLSHLSKGFTIKEIARLMGIRLFSVNDHIKGIYTKLKQVRGRATSPRT
ncbi:MAG: response regulator [Burkholderiales bacterium]